MKKAPNNLPAAGALGEQLTLIDPPPFCPGWPTRNSLADRAEDVWAPQHRGNAFAAEFVARTPKEVAELVEGWARAQGDAPKQV